MLGRQQKSDPSDNSSHSHDAIAGYAQPSTAQVKRATRTRFIWALLTSFLLLLTVIFMILVEVGNTNKNSSIRNSIYFIKLDLSHIVPQTVPDTTFLNTIAESLGLHDFYQVGLWNFCEGYVHQGITDCSKPKAEYWFDPVQIILSELLAGSTITLPAQVTSILRLIRIVSHVMFGLFLTSTVLSFVLIFLSPLTVISRWATLPIAILTFLNALFVTVASILATVMFVIMQRAFTSQPDIRIGASLGGKMFALMWIAAITAILAFLIQMGMCCCCASRRDVRTGRKSGSRKAWRTETPGVTTTTKSG